MAKKPKLRIGPAAKDVRNACMRTVSAAKCDLLTLHYAYRGRYAGRGIKKGAEKCGKV